MAITLKLGVVSKRKNSTYQPSSELGAEVVAVLKDSCSDYTPTFTIKVDSNSFPYNYFEWDGWFYWIENVIREKNQLITFTGKLDPLATYKSQIVNSTQFVAYDTTANTELVDSRLSKITTGVTRVASGTFTNLGAVASSASGAVVIGVVGEGGISYFALSQSSANQLFDYINTTTIPGLVDIPEISDLTDVLHALASLAHNVGVALEQFLGSGSAADCIKSTRMIALPLSAISGSSGQIYCGKFNTGVSGKKIDYRIVNDSVSIAVPWTYSDWRRNSPYTEHYFYSPFIGLIHLPDSEMMGATFITVNVKIDVVSGDIAAEMFATTPGGSVYIGNYSGSIAAEYSIGSSNVPISTQISALAAPIVPAALGMATGGLGYAAAVGTAGIAGVAIANTPVPTCISGGGGGACLGFAGNAAVIEVTHNTNVEPSSVSGFMGTPTMAVKSLSGLSGYVECRNATVAAPCSQTELDEIAAFMNGGIFIE